MAKTDTTQNRGQTQEPLDQEETLESVREECREAFHRLSLSEQRHFLTALDKSNNGQDTQAFKQALIDHAAEFGLDPEKFRSYPSGREEVLSLALKVEGIQP